MSVSPLDMDGGKRDFLGSYKRSKATFWQHSYHKGAESTIKHLWQSDSFQQVLGYFFIFFLLISLYLWYHLFKNIHVGLTVFQQVFQLFLYFSFGPIFKLFLDDSIKIFFSFVLSIQYVIYFECRSNSHFIIQNKIRFGAFFLNKSKIK